MKPVLFDIIHGTNRPLGWQAVYSQYLRTADNPTCFQYSLVVDANKVEEFGEIAVAFPLRSRCDVILNMGRECYVDAANFGCKATRAPILLLASDDMFPPIGWDTALQNLLYSETGQVVWVNDGCFPQISTMQILTREYFNRYGFVFKPEYPSMLGDQDFTRRALRDGVVIDVRDRPELHWTHHHHRNGLRPLDSSDAVNQSADRYVQGWTQFQKDWPDALGKPLIDAIYDQAAATPSDINEHLPFLKGIAEDATILELGTRTGNSSVAFLSGRPKKLVSVDLDFTRLDPELIAAAQLAGIEWERLEQDSRTPIYQEFDILLIDSLHTAAQVREELAVHASHAKKIIFHDTASCWDKGEDGGPGIGEAIKEFLQNNTGWGLLENFHNNNGLKVFKWMKNSPDFIWDDSNLWFLETHPPEAVTA